MYLYPSCVLASPRVRPYKVGCQAKRLPHSTSMVARVPISRQKRSRSGQREKHISSHVSLHQTADSSANPAYQLRQLPYNIERSNCDVKGLPVLLCRRYISSKIPESSCLVLLNGQACLLKSLTNPANMIKTDRQRE